MASNQISKSMVVAISQVAKVMGLETIAEHVENEQTVAELRAIGMELGQGFHLGKPAPMEQQLARLFHQDEVAARRRGGSAA